MQGLAVHGGLALAQDGLDLPHRALLVRHGREVVAADAADAVVAELAQEDTGKARDQPVAPVEAVLAVIAAQPDDVEEQQDGPAPLGEHVVPLLSDQVEEVAHVGQIGQPVVVELVVEVVDVFSDLVAHPLERAGQGADLVFALIAQLHLVVAVGQTAGGVGEIAERRGDGPDQEGDHGDKQQHDRGRDHQDGAHESDPGGVDLFGGGDAHELEAV